MPYSAPTADAIASTISCDDCHSLPESDLVLQDLSKALKYATSHFSGDIIAERRYGTGIPGLIVVFLFHITLTNSHDEWFWIVQSKGPRTHFPVDKNSRNPIAALSYYATLLEDWISAVDSGDTTGLIAPSAAPPTKQNAELLREQVDSIRSRIIPWLRTRKEYGRLDALQ